MFDMKCGNKGNNEFGKCKPVVGGIKKGKPDQANFIDTEAG
jgi:hypothetical protein